MKRDIHEECRNRWPSILILFGVNPSLLSGRQAPCPICQAGKDRFRFDNLRGDGTWICNACGAGRGMELFMRVTAMGFTDACAAIRSRLGETKASRPPREYDPAKVVELIKNLWDSAVPIGIEDDMAQAYLRSRGLTGPYPFCLRFASACRVKDHPTEQFLPAMIAPVHGHDGQLVAVHRTYLEDGQKAQWQVDGRDASCRRVMGKLPDGCAIRLGESSNGKLAVAEGIETALAVTQRFGMVCWALLNTTMMEKFTPPRGIRELQIFGDHDRKFGGQASAYRLAHRIAVMEDGPLVGVHFPQKPGDWADGLGTGKGAIHLQHGRQSAT